MARGRHKVDVLHKALKNKLYNELITDYETASRMLEA
jgi:DNA-binding transcriptional regulator LsrR (DeoR family)